MVVVEGELMVVVEGELKVVVEEELKVVVAVAAAKEAEVLAKVVDHLTSMGARLLFL